MHGPLFEPLPMLAREQSAADLETLERLLGLAPGPQPSVMIVSAHPDDETIGAGAQIPRIERLLIVEVTDGSPARPVDAHNAGFATRHAYAAARRNELLAALHLGGIPSGRVLELGVVDQEASLELSGLTRVILRNIWDFQADAVLTHPYEGGHPDHDACAFAVQEACRLMARAHLTSPARIEMAGYHAWRGEPEVATIETGEFLPYPDCMEIVVALDPAARELKRRMFNCFQSQEGMLSHFHTDSERFRIAPEYDFTRPPHPGRLLYERFDWGMSGARWRELAREALRDLEPKPEP